MNRPLIVGIAGALVVLAAILLTFFIDREPDRPLPPASGAGDRLDQLAADNSKTVETGSTSSTGEENTARALERTSGI